MRKILVLVLALSGCGRSVTLCAEDAGQTPEPDAEPGELDAGAPATISSVQACTMLEWAYHAGYGLSGGPDCTLRCPWPSTSGPGRPAERCDPAAVYACAARVNVANDCVRYDEAIDACARETCL